MEKAGNEWILREGGREGWMEGEDKGGVCGWRGGREGGREGGMARRTYVNRCCKVSRKLLLGKGGMEGGGEGRRAYLREALL